MFERFDSAVDRFLSSLLFAPPRIVAVVLSPFDTKPARQAEAKTEKIEADRHGFVRMPTTGEAQIEFVHGGLTESNGRSAMLTNEDRQEIANAELSVDKAAILKPFWARELSARQAANEIDRRGYGERTLDDYWAVFGLSIAE